MRTNPHTRKTMPQSWIDFFKYYKGKKYFEDGGFRCTAYEPEHDHRAVVQTATRRSWGRAVHQFNDKQKNWLESLGFKSTSLINIFYNTCAQMHGGMFIYDLIEMRVEHNCCWETKTVIDPVTGKKKKIKATVQRGVNDYYEVPLKFCKKLYDVWELPNKLPKDVLYRCAAWQYQKLTTKNEWDECEYDSINTWEDLPDWVFWKWMEVDGTIIKGREEAFEEFKNKVKGDARYIPTIYQL